MRIVALDQSQDDASLLAWFETSTIIYVFLARMGRTKGNRAISLWI